MKLTDKTTRKSSGSVLILALWVLMFLSALAVAVATCVGAGLKLAGQMKVRTAGRYLARAGVEKAMLVVGADTNQCDGMLESWNNNEEIFRGFNLGDGTFTVSHPRITASGLVVTNYGVGDEEAKVNINKAGHALLKNLIETAGRVDSLAAVNIASSIWDWRDEDDTPLTGGAENGYYQGLGEPYQCRNGEFQSLHELLLVKGVGYELFLRLRPYITLHGEGKININTADPAVLRSVAMSYGGGSVVADSLVTKIVLFRESGNMFREAAVSSMMKQLSDFSTLRPEEQALLSSMMGSLTLRSTCFGGTATGSLNGRSGESCVDFIFNRERMVKLYWHEY